MYGPPAIALAVSGAAATPDALVATTIVAVPLLNTPDAPTPGAVNVTLTPDTGLLPVSFTVTPSGFANAVLIGRRLRRAARLTVIDPGGGARRSNASPGCPLRTRRTKLLLACSDQSRVLTSPVWNGTAQAVLSWTANVEDQYHCVRSVLGNATSSIAGFVSPILTSDSSSLMLGNRQSL